MKKYGKSFMVMKMDEIEQIIEECENIKKCNSCGCEEFYVFYSYPAEYLAYYDNDLKRWNVKKLEFSDYDNNAITNIICKNCGNVLSQY